MPHRAHSLKSIVLFTVLAFILGIGASLLLLKYDTKVVLATLHISEANTASIPAATTNLNGVLTADEQHQLDFNTSFSAIMTDLQTKDGYLFDHYAFNDLITINQNTLGILRKIENSTTANAGLKDLATQLKSRRETEVEQLFELQKTTGHVHH